MTTVYITGVSKKKDPKSNASALHEAAHALLYKGLSKYGLSYDKTSPPALILGPHKKPYLADHPDIFFSVSHTAGMAACAVSEKEIGIDLQYIRETDIDSLRKIAKRFFTKNEADALCAVPDESLQEAFFRIWCAKEAYIKYTGEGIYRSLSSFETDIENIIISSPAKDYLLAVCGDDDILVIS